MKFITIAVFLFCIQLSAAMINAIDLTVEQSYSFAPQKDWINSVNDTVGESYVQNAEVSEPDAWSYVVDTVKGLWFFVRVFGKSIFSVPHTLREFGVPQVLITYMSGGVYLVYVLALFQLIMNRQTKGMD